MTNVLKTPFFFKSLAAATWAVILFGSTGLSVLRALGIASLRPTRNRLAPWLMAPAVGMGAFGSFSILCLACFGFSLVTLLGTWTVFIGAFLLLDWLRPYGEPSDELPIPAGVPSISNGKAVMVMLAAMVWAVVPTMAIYPFIHDGGLYISGIVADHVKIAMLDGIARGGLPLKNPFYAPHGQPILLSYSYGWYVLGAELKRLSHASGWQAEIGLAWYTAFAAVSFLAALASGLSGKARAGLGVVLLACTGPYARNVLPQLFNGHMPLLYGLTRQHELELPTMQFAWAPQHAFTGLQVCVLVWLLSAVLATKRLRMRYVLVAGMVAAAGFDCSTWVGCIALLAASPLVFLAAGLLRLPPKNYVTALKSAIVAAVICAALGAPILIGLFSGPKGVHQEHGPIGFALFPSTLLGTTLPFTGLPNALTRIVLFWVQLLPLCFGVIYVLGLPAIFLWLPRTISQRTFRALALATTIGYLLVSLLIRSTINANDLGWRAANVPGMLLLVFAAVALGDLTFRIPPTLHRGNVQFQSNPLRIAVLVVCMIIFAPGLVSTYRMIRSFFDYSKEDLPQRRLFARQSDAWEVVRKYTRPNDLVESNPDGFARVTPWAINMPAHLFADRSLSYACTGTGETYAFRYPAAENHRQYRMTQAIFEADPTPLAIQLAHDRLKIKAIVVTPDDPVWSSTAFEESGFYRKVAKTESYKVYIARNTNATK